MEVPVSKAPNPQTRPSRQPSRIDTSRLHARRDNCALFCELRCTPRLSFATASSPDAPPESSIAVRQCRSRLPRFPSPHSTAVAMAAVLQGATATASLSTAAAAAAPGNRRGVTLRPCGVRCRALTERCLPGPASLRSSLFGTGFFRNEFFARHEELSLATNIGKLYEARRGNGRGLVVRAAVFDQLTDSLEAAWTKLRKEDVLTKDNVKEPIKDIRRALLEADVSLPVVRRFVKSVGDKAIGMGVVRGVKPDQQLVKVVNDELVSLMGGEMIGIDFAKSGPTVILMAGLQGVGKTTACGKLALFCKKKGKSCMMVATDVYRPAAIDQLITLGKQVEVPVFEAGNQLRPAEIAKRGLAEAKKKGVDVVIVDTAGRLQVDRGMMDELKQIKQVVNPSEVLLVVDAMTGQEAAGLVASFNLEVGITGAILTKLDGDSRGGAALSVKEVSGKPIKFVGEGEGMSALEPFYPDRMASRILGMGDVLTFVEKAQEVMVKEDADIMQKRIMESKFDFNDFLTQTRNLARMGSMSAVMKFIPGMNKVTPLQIREAEKSLKIMESMIQSMTPKERADPELLAKSPSRRRRVAMGSGRSQEQVSALVAQLFQMRARMKNMAAMMQGGSIPGMEGLEDAFKGGRKAAPGTAKRKKSRGFASQLAESGAQAAPKRSGGFGGFGGKK